MKNLNVFVAGSHNGYGNTEYNVNWSLISEIGIADVYSYYFPKAVLPQKGDDLVLVASQRSTGCINPQSTTKIYLHKVNSIITDIYRQVWRRTHNGESTTVDRWSNLGAEGSEGIFNDLGFKTPIDKFYEDQEYWENVEREETDKWAAYYEAQIQDME